MTIKKGFSSSELDKKFGKLTFAKALTSERLSEEYSLKEFAKILGISPQSLCDLEKGRRIPSVARAVKIAKKLKEPEILWIQLALQDQIDDQGFKYRITLS